MPAEGAALAGWPPPLSSTASTQRRRKRGTVAFSRRHRASRRHPKTWSGRGQHRGKLGWGSTGTQLGGDGTGGGGGIRGPAGSAGDPDGGGEGREGHQDWWWGGQGGTQGLGADSGSRTGCRTGGEQRHRGVHTDRQTGWAGRRGQAGDAGAREEHGDPREQRRDGRQRAGTHWAPPSSRPLRAEGGCGRGRGGPEGTLGPGEGPRLRGPAAEGPHLGRAPSPAGSAAAAAGR